MKLVIQTQMNTQVKNIKEFQLCETISKIKSKFSGQIETPLKYELFRYKLNKGVVVIYKNNKRMRTKNTWYETRALTRLAQINKTSFYHQIKFKLPNGQETEVDGLNTENPKQMVEIKRSIINQDWIDFYELKRKQINMKECILIAPIFEKNLIIPSNISCFKFKPDLDTPFKYYLNDFIIPSWIRPYISSRHIRILLNNGKWVGLNRKLTQTAKHTPESKLLLFLTNLAKKGKYPIKIYYSLAPMLMPVEEYFGNGRPLPRLLAAIDVDTDPHQHIIGTEGYCIECLNNANKKAKILSDKLTSLGENFIKIYSGSKGHHFYLLNQDKNNSVKELPEREFKEFIFSLKCDSGEFLTDNINFSSKNGSFDLHRIFKLPNSIDNATGLLVQKDLARINFKDIIEGL
ncbi:MAG: hypothetical protein ACFE9S_17155 [Candidatus Hermodarchaeota archaeon]